MKQIILLLTVIAWLAASPFSSAALLDLEFPASDSRLEVTSGELVIDLSQAPTGAWDAPSAAPGKGVYDPVKWAVVFKYDFVFIAEGATVRFINHPSRAPVVWLVSGSGYVNIQGALVLDGQGWSDPDILPEPGPGGFRGGLSNSSGFGPGGTLDNPGNYAEGSRSYGNPQLVPLIGGSGAGSAVVAPGGSGAGAILIVARDTITIGGSASITANGGDGASVGSAGAIRLVADRITGQGRITAQFGSPGRIRLEANTLSLRSLTITPTPSLSFTPSPVILWPSENSPTIRVVSVGGVPAPEDPRSPLEDVAPDVVVASDSIVTIVLETKNFPTTGRVQVFVRPRRGAPGIYQATFVGGTDDRATWQIQEPLPVLEYAAIQARAVAP
jgi:hypothetical protein